MSHVIRKPAFCICGNKGADQLHSYCTADQRLCFRYKDRTIPLLLCAAWFVSDLVGNPDDRFSHDDATIHKTVSHLMRKPAICKCGNRGTGQLCSYCAADQLLCFRYKDSTIPLHYEQPGLCRTWSGNPEDRFSNDDAHFIQVMFIPQKPRVSFSVM